ncbi:dolichyl-phosphate-mannose--protein mannosyltransferase [Microbacterium sp. SS28]|uniref:dolichyl-phosphate-mannose--protein mannosyltransferase n=1 Tax=Microbacterium sp. SS28 TaxID=2919948 RepID=UPI001FA9B464|nr:phospholipid carrier-dependent glycosyltransferase [Microbacterium sp. SS28]
MTATSEPLLPQPLVAEVRPTFYERWRSRLDTDPRVYRVWSVLAPVLVTLLAGILRFWNLAHPHAIVFDETYYVKDAWSQWHLGFPSEWPDGADARFLAGETDIFTGDPSYVVHPPLGKWIIGAGMALFGADSTFGWRFAVALFGTATVLVLYYVARALGGSIVFAAITALFLAVDGLGIVLSRVAILDGILTFFVVLGFLFVLLDRRRHRERLEAAIESRRIDGIAPPWAPVFWNRPWILAAGAALGAATAVKWSGLYVIAAVGVYLVVDDALLRRTAGIGYWPTDAAFRQGLATFVLFVPVSFVVYLASWTGWLVTDGGYDRHKADASPASGLFAWVPLTLQSLWLYHQAIYASNLNLASPHSYASPAWQWPLLLRPTSMYYLGSATGENGCLAGGNGCAEGITSIPNPLLWWAAIIAVVYLVWRCIAKRVATDWLILTGIVATYAPWLLYPNRTIFQFYTIVILPFMLIALTILLRDLAQLRTQRGFPLGRWATGIFIVAVLAVSAWYFPVWTGIPVSYEFWFWHFNRDGWI